jgi:hypothetical protein
MAIGTDGQEINSKEFKVYVGSTDNEWRLLQNARVLVSHPVFREPTTSGGVKTFTGAPDHNISGSILFTRDEWSTADGGTTTTTSGLAGLLKIDDGEVPLKRWIVKFTDVSGISTGTTLTFENCKLSVADISKSVEGGVKVDITVVCPDEPT